MATDISTGSVPSYLPLPSSWNKWQAISIHGRHAPQDDIFPYRTVTEDESGNFNYSGKSYVPSNTLAIAAEIANTAIDISSPGGATDAGMFPVAHGVYPPGMAETLNLTFSRTGSGGEYAGTPWYVRGVSPRYGVSVGNIFKHQAYIGLSLQGDGQSFFAANTTWLHVYGTAKVEYCTNSRLKKLYIDHGLVVGIRTETDTSGKVWMYIKINDSIFPPPDNLSMTNSMKVWTSKVTLDSEPITDPGHPSETYDFTTLNKTWEIKVEIAAVYKDRTNFVKAGDFFKLDIPILLGDPAFIHEYELDVVKDAHNGQEHYETVEQRFSYGSKIIGLWTAFPKLVMKEGKEVSDVQEEAVDLAYVNEEYRNDVFLPKSTGESVARNEGMDWGGDFNTGKDILSHHANQFSNVKLIIQAPSLTRYQNFATQNLIGEFVEVQGGNFFQIVGHPRPDTILVSNSCLNSFEKVKNKMVPKSLMGFLASNLDITIYQQKFWMITEVYPGTPGTSGPTIGLWQGNPTEVSTVMRASNGQFTTTVKWTGSILSKSQVSSAEQSRTGSHTMDERFWRDLTNLDAEVIPAYTIGTYWVMWDASTQTGYQADVTVTPNSDGSHWDISAKISGDYSENITTSSRVYMMFDQPFKPVLSSPEANHFVYIAFDKALEQKNWSIFANGYYDMGRYQFESPLVDDSHLCVVSHWYGFGSLGSTPAIWASTRSTTACLAMYKNGLTGRENLFYNDAANDDLLVCRSGDNGWQEILELSPVRVGFSKIYDPNNSTLDSSAYAYTHAGFKIASEYPPDNSKPASPPPNRFFDTYWMGIRGQYFKSVIIGTGGVKTPMTRKYNISSIPTAQPIHLPYEYYAVVNKIRGNTKDTDVEFPMYCPASVPLSSIGLEKVTSDAKIKNYLGGGVPVPGTLNYTAQWGKYGLKNQFLFGSTLKDVFYMQDGLVFMIYGNELPAYKDASGTEQPSTNAVFIIASHNDGEEWGSPRYQKPNPTDYPDKANEWGVPMCVFRNFEYAGAAYDPVDRRFCIWGYDYEPNFEGAVNYLSLCCYQVGYLNLGLSATEAVIDNKTKKLVAYYRKPLVNPPALTSNRSYVKSTNGLERFVRVIGNGSSNALVKGKAEGTDNYYNLISTDQISASVDYVYLRDTTRGAIFRVYSDDRGFMKWKTDMAPNQYITDIEEPLLYALNAESPYLFGDHLFYVSENSLYYRKANQGRLDAYTAGESHPSQVSLDNNNPPVKVASEVFPQRLAARQTEGIIEIFYIRSDGRIGSSYSRDQGRNWSTVVNW